MSRYISNRFSVFPTTPPGAPVLHSVDRHNTLRCPADYDRGYYDGIKYSRRNAQTLLKNDGVCDAGRLQGRDHGYQDGYQDGRREGHRAGHRDGYQDRFLRGHERGHREGRTEGRMEGRIEGRAEGRTEGHRLGYKRGYDDGYQTGVAKTYGSTNATLLRGLEHEFVPGKQVVGSESAKKYKSPSASPLVVDGSSGPGVSPTAYKARLAAEEWQQSLRAHGMYMPVSEDVISSETQTATPYFEDQVATLADQQTDQQTELPVDYQVNDPEQDQKPDGSNLSQPISEALHDGNLDHANQAVEQPEFSSASDRVQLCHHAGRDTLKASQLDGLSLLECKAETADNDNAQHKATEADSHAVTLTDNEEGDWSLNGVVQQRYEGFQGENNGRIHTEDQHSDYLKEGSYSVVSVTEERTAPDLSINIESQIVDIERSVSTASLESDATVVIHRPDKPSTHESGHKSSLYFFGTVPVAIPKLPLLYQPRSQSVSSQIASPERKHVSIEAVPPREEEVQVLPEPHHVAEDSSSVVMHGSASSVVSSKSLDDTAIVLPEPVIPSCSSHPESLSETSKFDDSNDENEKEAETVSHPPQNPQNMKKDAAQSKLQFDEIVIFRNYEPDPPLRAYPSPLYQPQPASEIGPDQAPQITESYPLFRGRNRKSASTAYYLQPEHLVDPVIEIRDRNGTVFPVGGRTLSKGTYKAVPDHIVYKFGFAPPSHVSVSGPNNNFHSGDLGPPGSIGPQRLARCVQHGLSTCPMCAITPSYRFLGPGEAIARVLDQAARPCGDPQTNPASFWRFRPMGFGDFEANGALFHESAIAKVQHPDESDPFLPSRFMPQYDPEVLGHNVLKDGSENGHESLNKEKPLPPTALDTFYCQQCNGITWLVTRRTRPAGGAGGSNGGQPHQRGHGGGDRTFGKAHPSHHASYNEAWSRSTSFCAPTHRSRFPEQSGTTRSLFVQIAAVALPSSQAQAALGGAGNVHVQVPHGTNAHQGKKNNKKTTTNDASSKNADHSPRFGLAAYFGPGSRFNSRMDFDLATASMQVASTTPQSVPPTLNNEGRQRLLDMPYEVFTCNAGPIVAVAVALHRLWTEVVPAHRSAIDQVTRHNSDHSRRKAYRFRAILMTDSAYLVDLFSDQLRSRWQRKFRMYQQHKAKKPQHRKAHFTEEVDSSMSVNVEPGNDAPVVSGMAVGPKKLKSKNKKKSKKAKATMQAQDLVGNGNGNGSGTDVLVEITTATTVEYLDGADSTGNKGNKGNIGDINNDDMIEINVVDNLGGVSRSFSVATPASSRCRSPVAQTPPARQRSSSSTSSTASSMSLGPLPPAPPPTPVTSFSSASAYASSSSFPQAGSGGLFAHYSQNGVRDNLDFDRPDGRFLYCSTRGATLANSVLVHLAWRYMDLLRCHGVHVCFYHVDSEHILGARSLARECGE